MKHPRVPLYPVEKFFLDSGAFSLYNKVRKKTNGVHLYDLRKGSPEYKEAYSFFETKEFFEYLDAYALWVKDHLPILTVCANVDAIFNPELSYRNLKYLESKGIHPAPVLHLYTDHKWVEKYLEEGYRFMALGGLAGASFVEYKGWADRIWDIICSTPNRLPLAKVHGFAMTNWSSIFRYPWWSVDSTSWVKMAAYGGVFFPRRRKSGWVLNEMPRVCRFSWGCLIPAKTEKLHFLDFSPLERKQVQEWLDFIGIPLGSFDENGQETSKGVMTDWVLRAKANLLFYEAMRKAQPAWPWPFPKLSETSTGFFQ